MRFLGFIDPVGPASADGKTGTIFRRRLDAVHAGRVFALGKAMTGWLWSSEAGWPTDLAAAFVRDNGGELDEGSQGWVRIATAARRRGRKCPKPRPRRSSRNSLFGGGTPGAVPGTLVVFIGPLTYDVPQDDSLVPHRGPGPKWVSPLKGCLQPTSSFT